MKAALKKPILLFIYTIILGALFVLSNVYACTRVVYQGLNGTVITARSMDWKDYIPANLWVIPRGMGGNGEVGSSSLQ